METGEHRPNKHAVVPFIESNEPLGKIFNSLLDIDFGFSFPSSDQRVERSFIVHSTERPAEFWFILLAEDADTQQKVFTLTAKEYYGELSVKIGMSRAGFEVEAAKALAELQDDYGLTKPNDEDLADFSMALGDWISATGAGNLTPIV